MFDYRTQLCTGVRTLPCWVASPEDSLEENLNPIGKKNGLIVYLAYQYLRMGG